MIHPTKPNAQAAVRYLTWALGEIVKDGNQKAAQHVRHAIDDRAGRPAFEPLGIELLCFSAAVISKADTSPAAAFRSRK
jgi:hypothetical protein